MNFHRVQKTICIVQIIEFNFSINKNHIFTEVVY